MNRPTLALCCILKDEIKNLPQLLESVEGCFDEIYLTDTGSTDGSQEWIKKNAQAVTKCQKLAIRNFEWCDDFAKARNFSMKDVTADYVMWLDLDDVLSDKKAFIQWRDNVMMLSDFWLAPYHYSSDQNGKPVCTFLRERVVKTSKRFEWEYFIHEGMIAKEPVQTNLTNHWAVVHKRTEEDFQKDYERNVSMLEKRAKTEELPTRLKFYYGKELHDKGRFQEAYVWLDQIVDRKDLELHDRILTYEYLVRCCVHRYTQEQENLPKKDLSLVAKGLSLTLQATTLAPTRAEFWCLAGDCMVKLGKELEALPFYSAAKSCKKTDKNSFLFINHPAYDQVPREAISLIKFKMGDLDGAIFEAQECVKLFDQDSSKNILKHLLDTKMRMDEHRDSIKAESDDIVFSCIPGSHPYPFDEDIYKEKGIGGSETALVEVAAHMREITKRRVIVFNTRDTTTTCRSGVIYRPASEMFDYFSKFKPDVHFAWRHNIKLTDAPTYLWCHDLFTPNGEFHQNYDKIICLSEFHKNYVQCLQQIPDDKIIISRNGVNDDRFDWSEYPYYKNENKIVWPSSPDRGLERAIEIVKRARDETKKPLELHVYYGFDNLKKSTPEMQQLAHRLEAQIKENDWIKYHGNVEQRVLAKELMESVVWLYPANFIETYCITVLECIYAKCYPIVREIGALKNTVKPFVDLDMATLLFKDAATDEELNAWKDALVKALKEKSWEKIDASGLDYSWEGVARHFMDFSGLKEAERVVYDTFVDDSLEIDGHKTV